jgi:monomeric sarcosine oxidase
MQKIFDIAVAGAGVFGAWAAYQLRRAGAEVVLLDAYGAGNSRASSGGESRIIRMGYGPDAIYTRMAQRSLMAWKELTGEEFFQLTGVLWLAKENDEYCEATIRNLTDANVSFELLDGQDLAARYPQLQTAEGCWGILEPDSGVLMARRAVKAVVSKARVAGVQYLENAVLPPQSTASKLTELVTTSGDQIVASDFVFACGPWLPKLFPSLLGPLIHVTKQEVVFLGVPAGVNHYQKGNLPAWIDFNDLVYGIPNIDNRGFKIAIDRHGPEFDPDHDDRVVSSNSLEQVRSYLATRMPALTNAPVLESRVCQYENTSNGDFLIDQHPAYENVWLVGGGSGHGFKHGPAVGENVVGLISTRKQIEPRFTLATKERVRERKVF